MADKSAKDFEEFAYQFGEHCLQFNTHEYYKKWVEELIKDLTKDFTPPQIIEIEQIIRKVAETRIKQQKTNDVEYFIHRKNTRLRSDDDDAEGSSDNEADLYVDFM